MSKGDKKDKRDKRGKIASLVFSRLTREGPGAERDEQRKTGIARFFEVLSVNGGNLIKLNFIAAGCYIPTTALFILGLIFQRFFALFTAVSLIAAIPCGGAATAGYFIISKMLRDDPGFVWYDFKRKFKENFRSTLFFGVICAFITYAQLLALLYLAFICESLEIGAAISACLAVSFILIRTITPYVFLQAGYLTLKTGALIRNSCVFIVRKPLRSVAPAVIITALWVLYYFIMPVSLAVLLCFGIALNWFISLMFIWNQVDEEFKIEQTLRDRETEE